MEKVFKNNMSILIKTNYNQLQLVYNGFPVECNLLLKQYTRGLYNHETRIIV